MSKEESKKDKKTKEESKEESKKETPEEKKSKTKKFIIFTAILIILFLAIVFIPQYLQKSEIEKNKYNEFDFVKEKDGFWYTLVQKGAQPYWIPFYYHPKEVEDIPVDPNIQGKFFEMVENDGQIFITLDPDAGDNNVVIAGVEISRITGGRYDILNVPTRAAFTNEPTNTNVETGVPIITCANSNNKTLVVWLTLSHSNIAYSYDYCIRLEATDYEEMVRVADRVVYHSVGIMD